MELFKICGQKDINLGTSFFLMLENHCTLAQSLGGGCSLQVHKIVYLAVKKGNILVNILLLKIFITNYCHF